MKVGLLGGTFDPLHIGHVYIAKAAKEQYNLDEVWFIVNGDPPHKGVPNVDRYCRYQMAKLIVDNIPGFILKDDEIKKLSRSYTFETLEEYNKKYPDNEFYFIMGEDSLDTFDSWAEPERVAAAAKFLIAVRDDEGNKENILKIEEKAAKAAEKYNSEFIILKTDIIPISSTDIRKYLFDKDYEKAKDYLHPEVLNYIKEHRIYENVPEYDIDSISERLKTKLKEERFVHSVYVADVSASLAVRYMYPTKLAYTAGLLHDCAKSMSEEELLDYCKTHNIEITEAEQKSPKLLHAKVGSSLAKEEYGVEDEDVLNAIKTHTTGRDNMNLLQEIVYIADYIEPNRSRSKILDDLRYVAYRNKDYCILLIARDNIEFLKEKKASIDDMTLKTKEFYENKLKSRKRG